MGGKILSPINGKLLYAKPASVPETQAPAEIVINNKINEIMKFTL